MDSNQHHAPGNPFLDPPTITRSGSRLVSGPSDQLQQSISPATAINPFNPFNPFLPASNNRANAAPTDNKSNTTISENYNPFRRASNNPSPAVIDEFDPLKSASTRLPVNGNGGSVSGGHTGGGGDGLMDRASDNVSSPPPPPYVEGALVSDERLAIALALGQDDLDQLKAAANAQLAADEALALRLQAEETLPNPAFASLQRPHSLTVPPPRSLPLPPSSPAHSPAVDLEDVLSDEELARIMQQEEEYAAYGLNEQVRTPNSAYSSNQPQPSNFYGVSYQPPSAGYISPAAPLHLGKPLFPQHSTDTIGKPYFDHGFPQETSILSKFSRSIDSSPQRDLDICFWGNNCITVLQGSQQLYYMNTLPQNRIEQYGSPNRTWTIQRNDWNGSYIYLLNRTTDTKIQLFDPTLKKSITCAHHPTRSNILSFTTITNSEKLGWTQDYELRVIHEKGLFGGTKSKLSGGIGAGNEDDLWAYQLKSVVEKNGLERFRIRVGGRGLGKIDLIIGSFISLQLLK
ncbi:hypothetical protein HK100_004107 [Physocladia obscura]|uniref:Uncharacterized protein n=1 Tax=Physocladia obscura TaxID=109957 RepID=A0AAD5XD70_9FUNG|nr:hypothetical protein HK100_004107 [Physocladia obscura]